MADLFFRSDIKEETTLSSYTDSGTVKQVMGRQKKTDFKFHSWFRDPMHDAYGILLELNREKKHMEHVLVR